MKEIPAKPIDEYNFVDHGLVCHRAAMPLDAIDRYVRFWTEEFTFHNDRYSPEPHGLRYLYTDHSEVRDLLCHPVIREKFEEIGLGELAVHSDILNWQHNGSGFHCDVLADVRIPHCGVWIALDDIPEQAGWFTIYAESHKWDKELSKCGLTPENSRASDYVQDIISMTLMEPARFDARKGDILIWDTHCFHGAEAPQPPGSPLRKAAIAHLGEESNRVRHGDGMWYVP
jgi:hypothetical protein